MLLCIPDEAVSQSNLYRMDDCLMTVAPGGYAGADQGFERYLKAVAERVAYAAVINVNYR